MKPRVFRPPAILEEARQVVCNPSGKDSHSLQFLAWAILKSARVRPIRQLRLTAEPTGTGRV